MSIIKTAELIGAELVLWVARAEGIPVFDCNKDWPGNAAVFQESFKQPIVTVGLDGSIVLEHKARVESWSPSAKWSQGGPIIEREKINILTQYNECDEWLAIPPFGYGYPGPTPLIAAMRAFIARKFGDEFEENEVSR